MALDACAFFEFADRCQASFGALGQEFLGLLDGIFYCFFPA